jgi:hypothetical protein
MNIAARVRASEALLKRAHPSLSVRWFPMTIRQYEQVAEGRGGGGHLSRYLSVDSTLLDFRSALLRYCAAGLCLPLSPAPPIAPRRDMEHDVIDNAPF